MGAVLKIRSVQVLKLSSSQNSLVHKTSLCYSLVMKSILIAAVLSTFLGAGVQAQSEPVKMSKSGICHVPNSTYYNQTKNFTPYKTLDECLKSGGRMPKK